MSPIQRLQLRSLAAFGLLASTLGVGVALSSNSKGAAPQAPSQERVAPPQAVSIDSAEDGVLTMKAELDRGAVLRNETSEVKVRLTLSAKAPEGAELPISPTDLTVVLDVSGSMEGEKLAQAKDSILGLMANLTPGDRFGLISYSDYADWDVPLEELSGVGKAEAIRKISSLTSLGGTNIAAGLETAHDGVSRNHRDGAVPRVVLLSDGQATSGDTSDRGLKGRARRAREAGYSLTTVGFGEDYNETLMASLADEGVGNYYFIQGGEDLQAVFQGEFEATRRTVVKDVAITLNVPEGVSVTDVAGLPLERSGSKVTFFPGTFFDGQTRELWATLSVAKRASGVVDLGEMSASYKRLDGGGLVALKADSLGKVEVADTQEVVLSSYVEEVWADCVAEEEIGDLQLEVAKAVKAGDRAGAVQKIDAYRSKNQALNMVVSSSKVETLLEVELKNLQEEVEDAFTGENQAAKQKYLTKKSQSSGFDSRRAGSKYSQ